MLRILPKQTVGFIDYVNGLVFIGLNVLDAWLTEQLVSIGGHELSWWPASLVSYVVKGLLALVVISILVRLGKSKLLWLLNIGMSVVVLVNTVSFLSYLAMRYSWFR